MMASHRYKLTKLLLDEVFSALRGAQKNLSSVTDLASLPVFPMEDQPRLRDLTVVWEKTGLLGDLTLRLPDIVYVTLTPNPNPEPEPEP
jgi:hypothetical protein